MADVIILYTFSDKNAKKITYNYDYTAAFLF